MLGEYFIFIYSHLQKMNAILNFFFPVSYPFSPDSSIMQNDLIEPTLRPNHSRHKLYDKKLCPDHSCYLSKIINNTIYYVRYPITKNNSIALVEDAKNALKAFSGDKKTMLKGVYLMYHILSYSRTVPVTTKTLSEFLKELENTYSYLWAEIILPKLRLLKEACQICEAVNQSGGNSNTNWNWLVKKISNNPQPLLLKSKGKAGRDVPPLTTTTHITPGKVFKFNNVKYQIYIAEAAEGEEEEEEQEEEEAAEAEAAAKAAAESKAAAAAKAAAEAEAETAKEEKEAAAKTAKAEKEAAEEIKTLKAYELKLLEQLSEQLKKLKAIF